MVIGKDATESFEDVGHSDEAREILNTLFIGTFGEVCHYPHVRTSYGTDETGTETPR